MTFEPLIDNRSAEWIRDRCTLELPSVGSLMPQGFSDYLAIPHPIRARLNMNLTWSEVARSSHLGLEHVRSSADLLPQVTDLTKARLRLDLRKLELQRPETGNLPRGMLEQLIEVLGSRDTPTIFAVWDGWYPISEAEHAAHLKIRFRSWYLLQASLAMAAIGFTYGKHSIDIGLGPGMWWAADRSWIVVTDVDLEATHIGCSARVADALLESPLECKRVELTDRLLG